VTEGNLNEGEQIILGQTLTAGTNPQRGSGGPGR